ncbi:MAG: type II toxin-antitoxin system VapC family toxin [Bryobacteraceae bacterium]
MKLLLDTHAFLWAIAGDSKLSPEAANLFEQAELLLSAASIWEIVTKFQIGRLELPASPSDFLLQHLERNAIALLPILPRHVFRLGNSPVAPQDPLDRILAAQGLEESLPILTADSKFIPYGVETRW